MYEDAVNVLDHERMFLGRIQSFVVIRRQLSEEVVRLPLTTLFKTTLLVKKIEKRLKRGMIIPQNRSVDCHEIIGFQVTDVRPEVDAVNLTCDVEPVADTQPQHADLVVQQCRKKNFYV